MKQNNIDLVDVPDHVTSVMQDRNIPVQTLTPDFIVKCLKSNSSYTLLTLEDKMNIYNYLVSDGEFSRLHGLELLPINNGTFSVFGNLSLPFPKWSCRFCPVDLGPQISHPVRETNQSRPYK
jgi:hypothetical protein